MSRELIFYPAYRNLDTGKVEPLLYTKDGEPADVFWRSQSFIELDWFTDELLMMKAEDFDDGCRKYFVERYNFSGEEDEESPTYVYCLSEEVILANANGGEISGYVPVEEAIMYAQCEDKQEYLYWEMQKPIPAEIYAELPEKKREEYIRFSAIDRYSHGYVCTILAEVLESFFTPHDENAEKCFLVVYSF